MPSNRAEVTAVVVDRGTVSGIAPVFAQTSLPSSLIAPWVAPALSRCRQNGTSSTPSANALRSPSPRSEAPDRTALIRADASA